MAEDDVDVSQLNDSQQLVLQTYTSVTDQELSAAIPLLQRSQWNVQIAIAKFFDGETADPVEEARAALVSAPAPQQPTHRESLLNGPPSFPRSSNSSYRETAPRIVPQPESQTTYRPSFILSVLFTPFNLLYRLLSGSASIFGYFFPIFPRLLSSLPSRSTTVSPRKNTTGRRPLNPRDTAARFIREFQEEYGEHSLHFFENGYAQAYDLAKKDLQFLLVVLISPEHDDTTTFVRETLLSQEVTNYINDPQNKIVLWAGSVQDSEAYQISIALNCTKFPFVALIVHTQQDSSTSMSTIARITGLLTPSSFVAKLQTAIAQQSQALDRIRASRAEQQASRDLREEQNSAYERSLAQDRERARLRKEKEASKLQEELEARARQEGKEREILKMEQWRRWRVHTLPPEPGSDLKDAARVSIRMPSGERVIRRFAPSAGMDDLYAFVECHGLQDEKVSSEIAEPGDYEHRYKFNLVSPMPRTVYDLHAGGTVGDRIGRSGNLIVEPVVEDEDED